MIPVIDIEKSDQLACIRYEIKTFWREVTVTSRKFKSNPKLKNLRVRDFIKSHYEQKNVL